MAGHIPDSKSVDWCTPEKIWGPVDHFFGGIDLDPCSNQNSTVPAQTHICLPDDGLEISWFGKTYVNPPYGKELKNWVIKGIGEYLMGNVQEIIYLIPAYVDTKIWQNGIFGKASAICFLNGRVKFELNGKISQSAPMACALVYIGDRSKQFKTNFRSLGFTMEIKPNDL
jgi:site-specific DNA-methyltransferase (adenine-specific)